ncbi:MAG TPA: NnrU family protein [Xanthomonadaceae bacterium]|nr:NnrU family protein [Xanthomonadaceae bacterium]
MIELVAGLALFLGVHSLPIVAGDWRSRQVARLGTGPWKGLYALVSIAGFVLLVWGYGLARAEPVVLWTPPRWTYHLTIALTVPAFVLLAAAYAPPNRLRARIGHPMLAGTKLWALAHLASNGTLADVVLFGAFLAWAVVAFVSARRRDRLQGGPPAAATLTGDLVALLAGLALWATFAWWLHAWLIGIDPMVWVR